MFGWSYIKIAIIVAGIAVLGYAGLSIYNAGKDSVYDKLKDDRITILQDGKKIDEEVLAADDDELYCLVIDCVDGGKLPDDKPK